MEVSLKQKELQSEYFRGIFKFFILGGGTGSAKTFGILLLLHTICKILPGARIPIFRKSEKNLKYNTIPSFRKMLSMVGDHVDVRDMTAKYANGSEMMFMWADTQKDPDFDNVKGGEYTMAFFNELNQIDKGYWDICKTRVGRWNDFKIDGQWIRVKPAMFADFNPTDNWVKQEWYDKHVDGELSADTYFQLSLPKDNPFLSQDYLDMLETLPPAEYQRYVLGNWNYSDDPHQLNQYTWVKDILLEDVDSLVGIDPLKPEKRRGKRKKDGVTVDRSSDRTIRLGVDVARFGDDSTVLCYMIGEDIFKFEEYKKIDTFETAQKVMMSMSKYGITPENIIIDVVGVGGGVFDILKGNGLQCVSFVSGERPRSKTEFFGYINKRAEAHWLFREDIRQGKVGIINNEQFVQEAITIRYNINNDKAIQIEDKDDLKKRLKRSPNFLDAAVMVNYLRRNEPVMLDVESYKTGKKIIDIFDDSVSVRDVMSWF